MASRRRKGPCGADESHHDPSWLDATVRFFSTQRINCLVMSELSALRIEIKTWERSFKAKNGRDASVQDIRDQPSMGESLISCRD